MRARPGAVVVHDGVRHRQRGVLPAGGPAPDSRPWLYRCRRQGLLGRGQADAELSHRVARCRGSRDRCHPQPREVRAPFAYRPGPEARSSIDRHRARRRRGIAPLCLARASPGRLGIRQPRRSRCAPRPKSPVGRTGPVWRSAGREQWRTARCVGRNQRLLCRRLGRLAGLRAKRRANLALRHRGSRQRRAGRRVAQSRDARARFRNESRIRGDAGVQLPDAADRGGTRDLRLRVAGMAPRNAAGESRRHRSRRRTGSCVAGANRDVGDGASRPPGQDLPWGDDCEPQYSVGQQQGRYRRLSPGLAARSGGKCRRAAGVGCDSGSGQYPALSDCHSARRRPLVAEPVAGRQGVLGRGAARRDGVPDIAGNRACGS